MQNIGEIVSKISTYLDECKKYPENAHFEVEVKDLKELGWEIEDVNEDYNATITVHPDGTTSWGLICIDRTSSFYNDDVDMGESGDDAQTLEDIYKLATTGKWMKLDNEILKN